MTREQIKAKLKDFTYSDYLALYERYKAWLVHDKVEPTVHFPNSKGEIAVFQFRCNESIDFNDEKYFNDLLVMMTVTGNNREITDDFFDVTCDPKSTVPGIAHTCAQIYRGNVGPHRNDPNRPCIRSDYGFGTWINRTDGKGNIVDINSSDEFTSAPLNCGINIHNRNGTYNSSLGCTMFLLEGAYQKKFRPAIESCVNRNNIMIALIDEEDFDEILNGKPEVETTEVNPVTPPVETKNPDGPVDTGKEAEKATIAGGDETQKEN